MVKTAATCVAAILCTLPALAQPRIFALVDTPDGRTTTLWEASVDDGQVTRATPLATVAGQALGWGAPVPTAGGQFVVWTTSYYGPRQELVAFDRGSGTTNVVPGTLTSAVSDPTEPRLFIAVGDRIGHLSPAGLTLIPQTAGLRPIGVSPDGRRVYAMRLIGTSMQQLEVIDAITGALVLAAPLDVAGTVHVSRDEKSVWYVSGRSLLRRSIPSGTEEQRISLPPWGCPLAPWSYDIKVIDEDRRRVFVSFLQTPRSACPYDVKLTSLEMDTGTPGPVVDGPGDAFLDRANGVVLAYSNGLQYITGCGEAVLHWISAATGELLSQVGLGVRTCPQTSFAAPPPPPTLDPPVMSPTRTVTLSWARAPELTLRFTVEAGSAPGLSNLAFVPVMTGTTLTVPNVPPGTYYVRVRAWNYIGPSVPSNEIVVTVP